MTRHFSVSTPQELEPIAVELLRLGGERKLWAFYGEMGSGKTTFIHYFLRALGVKGSLGSPTYAIVSTHQDGRDRPVYHFDFYRFKSPEEAYDMGYEMYFFDGAYCFMEWPERIGDLLPDDAVKVYLREEGTRREIEFRI